jgi:hypothetical protein
MTPSWAHSATSARWKASSFLRKRSGLSRLARLMRMTPATPGPLRPGSSAPVRWCAPIRCGLGHAWGAVGSKWNAGNLAFVRRGTSWPPTTGGVSRATKSAEVIGSQPVGSRRRCHRQGDERIESGLPSCLHASSRQWPEQRDEQDGRETADDVHWQANLDEVGEAIAAGTVDHGVGLVADRRGEAG